MKKNINKYDIKGEHTILTIIDSKGKETKAIVDTDKVDMLKNYSFRTNGNGYIKTGNNIYIHQLVLGKGKQEIDHINRNKLDNRVCNLRYVSRVINANNKDRTEDTNIRYLNRNLKKRWYVRYYYNNEYYFVGYFATKEEAQLNLKLHRERTIKA
jgi:hypothetical protein